MFSLKINSKIKPVSLILCVILSLNGCMPAAPNEQGQAGGGAQPPSAEGYGENYSAMLLEQGIALPESLARIYVNQAGYSLERGKKAVFALEEGVDTFRVVRASDKETVYTGEISALPQNTLPLADPVLWKNNNLHLSS